jgi:capsular exopolysaccharide synthesis family protein
MAMAQVGLSVVTVDADLRRPRLHQLFGLGPREGATREGLWWGLTGSLLEGHTNGLLQPTQVEGLRVLPSGELPPNPAEMIGSQRMQQLLHDLAQQADVVLIDSPPVLPVADAKVLAQGVDGVLLVVDAGHTRREAARHTVESLRQVGANLVGVVLNGLSRRDGYYHYYYQSEDGQRQKRRWRSWLRRRRRPREESGE